MAKHKYTIYREQLSDAYSRCFQEMRSEGGYLPTPKMQAISAVGEIIRRCQSRKYRNIFRDGNRIYIREITGLYELGTTFNTGYVQAILRGLECNYEGVHTCICLDLNSAWIDDIDGLVKDLIS